MLFCGGVRLEGLEERIGEGGQRAGARRKGGDVCDRSFGLDGRSCHRVSGSLQRGRLLHRHFSARNSEFTSPLLTSSCVFSSMSQRLLVEPGT